MKLKEGEKYTIIICKEVLRVKLQEIDSEFNILIFDFLDKSDFEEYKSSSIIIDYSGDLKDQFFYTGNNTKVIIKKSNINKRLTKKTSKKRSVKKTSKKRSTKKTSKKRSVKKTSKKRSAKKTSKKRSAKKTSKKRSAKKTSKKRSAKKTSKKRSTKRTIKKTSKKLLNVYDRLKKLIK